MGGEWTCGQILHSALCQLAEGHHALGPGEGKGLRGQAIGGRVVLSHVSHLLSTALSSMSPATPASPHCALACRVLPWLLPASQGGSGVPLLPEPAAKHWRQCQATSPSLPPPGQLTACCGGSASGHLAGLQVLAPRCHWLSYSP